MTVAEKVATQLGALCVGGTAFALGDPSGGTLLAVPLTALAAIGVTLKSGCAASAAERAKKAVLKSLEGSHEFADAVPRAKELLDALPTLGSLDPKAVARQVHGTDFEDALCDSIIDALGIGEDDKLHRVMRPLVLVGIKACKEDQEFRQKLTLELVIESARKQGIQVTLLKEIKEDTAAIRKENTRAGEERAVLHAKTDLLRDGQDETNRMLRQMLEQVRHDPKHRDEVERRGKLVTELARRYADGNPGDFDGALAGLERALDVAAEERTRGALPGNVSDAVDAVVARVDALNDEGRVDEGARVLRDALARAQAAQARIVDKGIAQAVLARDVGLAVDMELARLALDGGGFAELRQVQDVWYERGRDKGLRFDLEVSIALAQVALDRAANRDDRGAASNDLGLALATLGDRESGTARLDAAVTAYEAALLEYTRDRAPLNWAMTQNNLGNALQSLGTRESGTARLDAAVAAYEAALLEWTREQVPLDWAMTQNNLGTALRSLGERERGTARLDAAVAAYEAALLECTREQVPLDWAMTQNNLGNALATLGDRESGTARLDAAVAAYEAALLENTRERVPLNWATTQNNLGNALLTLGQRESGTARLDAAVAAYEATLLERTRERVPLDWAKTQGNLCTVYVAFFDKSGAAEHLTKAQHFLDAARAVFSEAGASQYLGWADQVQAKIDTRRDT